jgi:hypothetical protein
MIDSAKSPGVHAAGLITARNVIIVLIIMVAFVLLLAIPVLYSYGFDAFSGGVRKASKGTFLAGLAVLIVGLISGVRIIDYAGGGVMAAVIIGIIIDQYLTGLLPRAAALACPDQRPGG